MLRKLRERIQSEEKGFTLIELLVVVLIIGILAAIAIPAFLGQREKAQDSEAKTHVRNAATAMEAWFTDNGTYADAAVGDLTAIEPSLNDANGLAIGAGADTDTYAVTTSSDTTTTFTITKDVGQTTRSCGPAARQGDGGCRANGSW
jgi:type IV pilus assembly protein PilA